MKKIRIQLVSHDSYGNTIVIKDMTIKPKGIIQIPVDNCEEAEKRGYERGYAKTLMQVAEALGLDLYN